MGCSSSKAATGAQSSQSKASQQAANAKALAADKERRAKLDPKDFIISQRTKEVIVREAGSIDGEQFNIENCVDCDIFLLDHMDSSFVDDCKNCRIFLGPTMSSVFIRNCIDCSFMIACRQFRSRDCENCRFALMATTEPVIETSKNMQFACLDFFYFSLGEQLERANIKVWNNKWWQIHDFNKNAENPNWSVFPQEDVCQILRTTTCTNITENELTMDCCVPVTLGCRPKPFADSCFVVFMPESQALVVAFLARARLEDWVLCRTRATPLSPDRAKQLFAWTKENLAARCVGQEMTGIEVCGLGIHASVANALGTTGLAAGADRNIRVVPTAETPDLAKKFFETWKDEI